MKEIKNSDQLVKMLSGLVMDIRRGDVSPEQAKEKSRMVDKIIKENTKAMKDLKASGGKGKIKFFECLIISLAITFGSSIGPFHSEPNDAFS